MRIYKLESIGMVMDKDGVVYPVKDGQPVWDQGLELTRDDAGEWWDGYCERLSDYDKATVLNVWYVEKKVWWDSMTEAPDHRVVAELKERESNIHIPPPALLVDMLRFG